MKLSGQGSRTSALQGIPNVSIGAQSQENKPFMQRIFGKKRQGSGQPQANSQGPTNRGVSDKFISGGSKQLQNKSSAMIMSQTTSSFVGREIANTSIRFPVTTAPGTQAPAFIKEQPGQSSLSKKPDETQMSAAQRSLSRAR